jgi:hypothetical protein
VTLTDDGHACIARAYPAHVRRIVDAFAALDPADVTRVAVLAKRLGTARPTTPEEVLA